MTCTAIVTLIYLEGGQGQAGGTAKELKFQVKPTCFSSGSFNYLQTILTIKNGNIVEKERSASGWVNSKGDFVVVEYSDPIYEGELLDDVQVVADSINCVCTG